GWIVSSSSGRRGSNPSTSTPAAGCRARNCKFAISPLLGSVGSYHIVGRVTLYRVHGDETGETHLATLELPVIDVHSEGVARIRGLVGIPATSAGVIELLEPTPSQDLHPAPERRLLVFLSGETEIRTTSGDRLVLKASDCLLADDVGTKGHYT